MIAVRLSWAPGAFMLLLALVAKQFVGEPTWIDNLAQIGALLVGVGFVFELVSSCLLYTSDAADE